VGIGAQALEPGLAGEPVRDGFHVALAHRVEEPLDDTAELLRGFHDPESLRVAPARQPTLPRGDPRERRTYTRAHGRVRLVRCRPARGRSLLRVLRHGGRDLG